MPPPLPVDLQEEKGTRRRRKERASEAKAPLTAGGGRSSAYIVLIHAFTHATGTTISVFFPPLEFYRGGLLYY